MKRILFVDDDTSVLDGLRNLLRKHRRRWEMVFVTGGQEALSELGARPFDVIVSDMRMPGMDGAELLRRVKDEHPKLVRLILSGHADRESIFRALPVAHQFLTKPCDAEALPNVIERACELQALIHDESLARLVGGIDSLPSPPKSYWRITNAMADPKASMDDVAAIVEGDPAVCAKLLQLVNSAYFGLSRPVSSVPQAISFLGLELVRSLVLSAHILRSLSDAPVIPGYSYETAQSYALLTAKVAKRIMGASPLAQECFTAALLHDLGKVVIALAMPERFGELVAACAADPASYTAREKAILGFTHAEVGAYLLGLWGLPGPIVEAVAHHHEPARVAHRTFEIVDCVHVADALVDGCVPRTPGVSAALEALDLAHLTSLGAAADLPSWRAIAEEEARAWDVRA